MDNYEKKTAKQQWEEIEKSREKYKRFLETKLKTVHKSGFEVDPKTLNKNLFPFQSWIVERALEKGKFAIWADCGLGKTLMQLEWARQVSIYTGKPVLILCPLAVAGQTIKEGEKFGIPVVRYGENGPLQITNYDQLKNIDCSVFGGVVLDESSILKNFTGKMRNALIEAFVDMPYKLCCTATPSPNDPMEIGNHAEFLNVMTRNEMLSMFFVHDGGNTSKWRLKKHAVRDFYKWVGTWAVMLSKPDDIGFHTEGYDLPELNISETVIKTPAKDGVLFNTASINATAYNAELRITIIPRLERAAEIVNGSKENFIVWIKQNGEGQKLRQLIPDAVEVRGSDDSETKEKRLLGFGAGEFRVLVTKTQIAQFGLNYQNCGNQIFASLDFSFEGLYQAIRRSWRFGRKDPVSIWIITTDTMANVLKTIKDKQAKFIKMQKEMSKAIFETMDDKDPTYQSIPEKVEGDKFTLLRGDCVQRIKEIPDHSIGHSIFSPPFADLYTYSDKVEDMGNVKDWEQFLEGFKYLVSEFPRIMMPGRNVAVHCMDLPIQKGKEGFIGLRDFSGMIRDAFEEVGCIYHSRVTIWKNPVTEMQRTKALGLLHKQVKKDSVMSRVGMPDYLLVFRMPGENPVPIETNISVDLWQKWASPVWMDIDYGNTLQYMSARDSKDEKHICPLQLDTIERSIGLWSNPGETIFSPFAGIGSEIYQAVKMGRKGIGIELKESYFNTAILNCRAAEQLTQQLTLL